MNSDNAWMTRAMYDLNPVFDDDDDDDIDFNRIPIVEVPEGIPEPNTQKIPLDPFGPVCNSPARA